MVDFQLIDPPEEKILILAGVSKCPNCGKTRGTGEVLRGVPCECGYTPKALETFSIEEVLMVKQNDYDHRQDPDPFAGTIWKCRDCGAITHNPRPDPAGYANSCHTPYCSKCGSRNMQYEGDDK